MPGWNPRVNELFLQALDRPPADRPAFLAGACGADDALRQAVDTLLAAHDQAGDFLSDPFTPDGTGTFQPETRSRDDTAGPVGETGQLIAGRYKLVERIGEGGMGAVWLAEQTEPVKRKVAVKLIKAGLDSKQVLARFEAERQALALMDHPNIAKVLDGGVHDGRPFFVMELVKGVPITAFCDARRLTPQHRLELFVPVCQAIQHAHQKGIIHRDIKPANVLVALYDDRPVPKVIDFGVAKATGPTLTEHTLNTGFGGVVGTPQYMSPEQATFNNLDIDTRSDVYSLGVLLYELLAGSPPFAGAELKKRGLLEILRVVREEEPPRPSTKLSTADALPTLAASRGTEPRKLTGLLRNELDWIVMRALEKDRARRYETANGFAADVQRYLAGEPVAAVPPSPGYRLRKFVRKNKGPVTATSVVLLTLLAGLIATSYGFYRADVQRQRAEGAERSALANSLAATDAAAAAKAATDEETKQRAKAEANEKLATERLEQAEDALGQLAVAHRAAGKLPDAIALYDQLRQSRVKRLGENDPLTLSTLSDLATAYQGIGRSADAVTLLEQVRVGFAKARGDLHPDTLAAASKLAQAYQAVGRWAESIALLEQARAGLTKSLGKDHPDTLNCNVHLALAYRDVGRNAEAVKLFEDTLNRFRTVLGNDHPHTLNALNNLAQISVDIGRLSEATRMYEEALNTSQRVLGPDHRTTLSLAGNLAAVYSAARRFPDAIAVYERTRDTYARRTIVDYPQARNTLYNLAAAYRASGKVEQAVVEVTELRKLPGWNANQLYNFACVYAVASGRMADKKREYADAAMDLLTKAVKAGYTDAAHMKRDTDLDPLRGRDDFKKLFADLEKKFPPKREVLPPPRKE